MAEGNETSSAKRCTVLFSLLLILFNKITAVLSHSNLPTSNGQQLRHYKNPWANDKSPAKTVNWSPM